MGNFKNLVFALTMLFCDVVVVLGHSKVSKDFLNNLKPTEYSVPKMYHPSTRRNITTTPEKNDRHLDSVEIVLPMKNKHLVLDLQLNRKITSKAFKQIYHNNGKLKVNKPSITDLDYCHYTGSIKYEDNSWVALSTCNGINGIIFDGNNYFFIEKPPKNDSDIHHIYISPPLTDQAKNSTNRRKRDTLHNVLAGPYNENKDSRYIELVLVFDNQVYKKLGGVTDATSYAIAITNLINAYYSRVNIFVILVGVVVWTEQDEFYLETGTILNEFTKYVKTKLVEEFYFDSAHLISSINVIEDGVGVAGVGTVCDNTCTGVNDYLNNIFGTAITVAHELGHNIGLVHDDIDCSCPEDECIMTAVRSTNTMTHFSSCSIDTLQQYFDSGKHYCLKNRPEAISSSLSSCGNGILEPEEECDCGLQAYCKNNCCDALTCRFKNDSQCASGPCCDLNTCKLKEAATPCRPASNECDLSEYCTGESHNCPEDTFKLDTEQCNNGQSYCHQGFCGNKEECSARSTTLNKKYLECYKINSHFENENNYCKNNIFSDATFVCDGWYTYSRTCSHPKYETIIFGSKAVGIHTSVYGNQGSLIVCTLTIIDNDPAAVQDASVCYNSQVQCLTMSKLRAQVPSCPVDCRNNGWCNNKGQCHCKDGYAPPDCSEPGFGGSLISGPSTNPYGFILVRNIMFIIFLGIVPLVGLTVITYCIIKDKHSKKDIPTISKHIVEQEKTYHNRKNNFNQNNNNLHHTPVLIPGHPHETQTNYKVVNVVIKPVPDAKPTIPKTSRSSIGGNKHSSRMTKQYQSHASAPYSVINKTVNQEQHYQVPNTNAVTNPLYDRKSTILNFLKRSSIPVYSNIEGNKANLDTTKTTSQSNTQLETKSSTLHSIINKTVNQEPHCNVPKATVTNPLENTNQTFQNFLKRWSVRKSNPVSSNKEENKAKLVEVEYANQSNVFKNKNSYKSRKLQQNQAKNNDISEINFRLGNKKSRNPTQTVPIKRTNFNNDTKHSSKLEHRHGSNEVYDTNIADVINPLYGFIPPLLGFSKPEVSKRNSLEDNEKIIERNNNLNYKIISNTDGLNRFNVHSKPKANQLTKSDGMQSTKSEETKSRTIKNHTLTPSHLKTRGHSNVGNKPLKNQSNHQSNTPALHSQFNKYKNQNQEQSNNKDPGTLFDTNNRSIHSKIGRRETDSEILPVAQSYYDEFAKRKKRILKNPASISQQKSVGIHDPPKTENNSPYFPGTSPSDSDYSKVSVREMIQRFDT